MKITLLNDKKNLNVKYRRNIINACKFDDIELNSIGICNILQIINNKCNYLISSNIKANIISLLLNKNNTLIILNGLGRYRKIKIFRAILILLLTRFNGFTIIQNYADYRYFTRFTKNDRYRWILGSGAYKKITGTQSGPFAVTRCNKIALQKNDIESFNKHYNKPLRIVGTKGLSDSFRQYIGEVEQKNVLRYGNMYVQLSGYGEGLPHSLCEAIYNNLTICIRKKTFIQFGLYRLDFKIGCVNKDWLEITIHNPDVFSAKIIAQETMACLQFLHR